MKKAATIILIVLAIIALFADFIANDAPIVFKTDEQWTFPIFINYQEQINGVEIPTTDWSVEDADFIIRTLIPYSPSTNSDLEKLSPLEKQPVESWQWRHWMGTDKRGRDVAAGMVHGTRTAFMVGGFSMLIAGLIGILLGGLAGFFGDDRFRWPRVAVLFYPLAVIMGFLYGFYIRRYAFVHQNIFGWLFQAFIGLAIVALFILLSFGILRLLENFAPKWFTQPVKIPLDTLILRLIELFNAIPALLFILTFAALFKKASFVSIIIIIGLVFWTRVARLIRSELLVIRELPYIEALRALGLSEWRILFRHAIPNGLPPVLVVIAFGMASAILAEAALSFLQISETNEMMSWGGILQLSRGRTEEWWLAFFPGVAIFIVVTCLNSIGDALSSHSR